MHYKDGTTIAQAGDLVKGTCYNTRDAKGQPAVIVGVLLGITPDQSACNCRVAITRIIPGDPLPTYRPARANGPDDKGQPFISGVQLSSEGYAIPHRELDGCERIADAVMLSTKVDYSQCDHLELVHRPTA